MSKHTPALRPIAAPPDAWRHETTIYARIRVTVPADVPVEDVDRYAQDYIVPAIEQALCGLLPYRGGTYTACAYRRGECVCDW